MSKIIIISDVTIDKKKKYLIDKLHDFTFNSQIETELYFIKSIKLDSVPNDYKFCRINKYFTSIDMNLIAGDEHDVIVSCE